MFSNIEASWWKDASFIHLSKSKKYVYRKPNICNIRPAYKEYKAK